MLQEALDRWWPPLMQMHGPRSPREQDRDLFWRIKAKTSEELRQEFLGIYVPRIRELGLTLPDPALRLDEDSGRVALHGARLGRAARRRHGARAGVGRAGRLPAGELGRAGVGAGRDRGRPPGRGVRPR